METQEDTELIGGVAGIATEAASSRIHTCNFWNDVLQFFFFHLGVAMVLILVLF